MPDQDDGIAKRASLYFAVNLHNARKSLKWIVNLRQSHEHWNFIIDEYGNFFVAGSAESSLEVSVRNFVNFVSYEEVTMEII